MNNGMMIKETVAVVERERMVDNARRSQRGEVAQGGQYVGPVERITFVVSALLQRMGRPRGRGSAPAGEGVVPLKELNVDGAR